MRPKGNVKIYIKECEARQTVKDKIALIIFRTISKLKVFSKVKLFVEPSTQKNCIRILNDLFDYLALEGILRI